MSATGWTDCESMGVRSEDVIYMHLFVTNLTLCLTKYTVQSYINRLQIVRDGISGASENRLPGIA